MRLLFIILILSLTACTITKRHFGHGYQVEWKKSVSKSDNETDKLDVIDLRKESSALSEESREISQDLVFADTVHNNELTPLDNSTISIQDQSETGISETQIELKNDLMIQSDEISNDEDAIDEPKRRVELFTWISLGGLVLAIIFVILSFTISMEFSFFFAAVHYFVFAIGSMISVAQVRKNPAKYKGKGLTWTLFGLSLATIAATLCFTIYKLVDLFSKG